MFEKFVDSMTHSQPGATPNGYGVFEEFAAGLTALDPAAMHRVERRDAAVGAKLARAALDAFEARLVSASSRLDGGRPAAIELMRASGGCSGREAHRRFRRAAALVGMPAVAGALAEGSITSEHADALARAAEAISAETVEADEGLLERVKSLPADLAAREVTDWVHRHQSDEDREARFHRQRAMRSHRMWTDSDGTVNSRGRFDSVTGAQIKAVIDDLSNRLYQADGGREGRSEQVRTWDQRNADALAMAVGVEPGLGLVATSLNGAAGNGRGRATGTSPGRWSQGTSRDSTADSGPSRAASRNGPARAAGAGRGAAGGAATGMDGRNEPAATTPATGEAAGRNGSGLSLRNRIMVMAHTDAITGADPAARCEIPGAGPIPRSELERLACEAEIFGVLFSGDGQPLWHGRRLRTVSPQQWRALLARDRGCVLCGAGPGYCHAHHIVAWTAPARGPTDIDNLVLVCNRHHRLIHQHGLTLARGPDGGWVASAPDNRQVAGDRGLRPADRKPADHGRKPGGWGADRGRQVPEARSPVTIRAGP